jgi:hypothetical protein
MAFVFQMFSPIVNLRRGLLLYISGNVITFLHYVLFLTNKFLNKRFV